MKIKDIDVFVHLKFYIQKLTESQIIIVDRIELMNLLSLNAYQLYAFLEYAYSKIRYVKIDNDSTIYLELEDGIIYTGIYNTRWGKKINRLLLCPSG